MKASEPKLFNIIYIKYEVNSLRLGDIHIFYLEVLKCYDILVRYVMLHYITNSFPFIKKNLA